MNNDSNTDTDNDDDDDDNDDDNDNNNIIIYYKSLQTQVKLPSMYAITAPKETTL